MDIEKVRYVFTPLGSQQIVEKEVEFQGFKDKMSVMVTRYFEVTAQYNSLHFTIKEKEEQQYHPQGQVVERTLDQFSYYYAVFDKMLTSDQAAVAMTLTDGIEKRQILGDAAATMINMLVRWLDPEWFRTYFPKAWEHYRDRLVTEITRDLADT